MMTARRQLIRINLLLAALALLSLAAFFPHSIVFAANPPGTGQPSQDCESLGVTPGLASSAPGSAFNTNGVAPSHYAGQLPQNSNNPMSVSQYDVACFQVSQH